MKNASFPLFATLQQHSIHFFYLGDIVDFIGTGVLYLAYCSFHIGGEALFKRCRHFEEIGHTFDQVS